LLPSLLLLEITIAIANLEHGPIANMAEQQSQPLLPAQTLAGKVAIVTGSSRGLGADMALDLARRGAKVSYSIMPVFSFFFSESLFPCSKELARACGHGSSVMPAGCGCSR
jgi:hypothetical protein